MVIEPGEGVVDTEPPEDAGIVVAFIEVDAEPPVVPVTVLAWVVEAIIVPPEVGD